MARTGIIWRHISIFCVNYMLHIYFGWLRQWGQQKFDCRSHGRSMTESKRFCFRESLGKTMAGGIRLAILSFLSFFFTSSLPSVMRCSSEHLTQGYNYTLPAEMVFPFHFFFYVTTERWRLVSRSLEETKLESRRRSAKRKRKIKIT